AAERAATGVVVEQVGGVGHRAEDVLGQVGGVGVLEAALAAVAVHHRGVDLDELPPGVLVPAVPDAGQQAGPGGGRLGHGAPPQEYFWLRRETYRQFSPRPRFSARPGRKKGVRASYRWPGGGAII